MGFCVFLDKRDARGLAPCRLQISERLAVYREEAAGRTIFRRHIGDRRAVLKRHIGKPGAEELHKFPHNAALAQHLGHGKHKIGRCAAGTQFTSHSETDDFGNEH